MAIEVVDGNGQSGSVGELLTAPVVVKVTDASGDPVEGVTVDFALTSAGQGAEISPATARTGADGRAGAHILLGDKVGLQTGEARVAGDGASLARRHVLGPGRGSSARYPTSFTSVTSSSVEQRGAPGRFPGSLRPPELRLLRREQG